MSLGLNQQSGRPHIAPLIAVHAKPGLTGTKFKPSMRTPLNISIVLGASPSRLNPIRQEQLEVLAARRKDVALRIADTGSSGKRDVVVIDPSGRVPGELLFIDGRLQICDPEQKTLQWMIELASELGGRVKDNTLRTYRSPNETFRHPEDRDARAHLSAAIREARKIDRSPKRGSGASTLLFFLVVVVVGAYLLRTLGQS